MMAKCSLIPPGFFAIDSDFLRNSTLSPGLNAEIRRRKVGDIFPDGSSFFPVISGFPSALRHLNFL